MVADWQPFAGFWPEIISGSSQNAYMWGSGYHERTKENEMNSPLVAIIMLVFILMVFVMFIGLFVIVMRKAFGSGKK
jgi:hypothetical protein